MTPPDSGDTVVVSGTTIGVLGATWRATVTPWGDVLPWGDEAPLRWYVAADDRWHVPEQETAVRQRCVDGAPVLETRLRIPTGDAVQRVWATGDGITVVEVENDSAMPIAVAFTRRDVLTSRPPTDVPVEGIDLPAETIVLPVGHRSTVRVGLAHDGRGAGSLPDDLPPALQVARGWTTLTERASRVVVPDVSWSDALVSQRCRVSLEGPADPDEDPVAFLIGVGELVRTGDLAEPWTLDVVSAAETLLRRHRRDAGLPWDTRAALLAAATVLARADETRGCDDVLASLDGLAATTSVALAAPDGIRAVPWIENRLARLVDRSCAAVLPDGVPVEWLGVNVEAYRVPAGPRHHVSFAVRWHGERPALLWEVEGPAGLRLTGGGADPSWSTVDPSGETLLAAPAGAPRVVPADEPSAPSPVLPTDLPADGGSFS